MATSLNGLQRLAIMEAFVKKAREATDPKGAGTRRADNLRTVADDELKAEFLASGTDRRRIMLNGVEVGTLSISMSKAVDGSFPEVTDPEMFVHWLRTSDGGLDTLRRMVFAKPADVLKAAIADGELPDGCDMRQRHEPPRIKGTTLRVTPEKVGAALAGELPSVMAGLLGAGAGEVE